ncbi:hypothetical protein ACMXYX_17715 (plasmid) [Neptuniibacter sp. QD72_48]|uniref:hypothetical protein n=1 Tax=Neptuniibacter sp. QD72_48 TaxID=3398214 RepID=UPI0039F5C58F
MTFQDSFTQDGTEPEKKYEVQIHSIAKLTESVPHGDGEVDQDFLEFEGTLDGKKFSGTPQLLHNDVSEKMLNIGLDNFSGEHGIELSAEQRQQIIEDTSKALLEKYHQPEQTAEQPNQQTPQTEQQSKDDAVKDIRGSYLETQIGESEDYGKNIQAIEEASERAGQAAEAEEKKKLAAIKDMEEKEAQAKAEAELKEAGSNLMFGQGDDYRQNIQNIEYFSYQINDLTQAKEQDQEQSVSQSEEEKAKSESEQGMERQNAGVMSAENIHGGLEEISNRWKAFDQSQADFDRRMEQEKAQKKPNEQRINQLLLEKQLEEQNMYSDSLKRSIGRCPDKEMRESLTKLQVHHEQEAKRLTQELVKRDPNREQQQETEQTQEQTTQANEQAKAQKEQQDKAQQTQGDDNEVVESPFAKRKAQIEQAAKDGKLENVSENTLEEVAASQKAVDERTKSREEERRRAAEKDRKRETEHSL